MPIQEMPTIIHEKLDHPRVRTPLLPSVRKNTKPVRKPWFYAAALVILAAVAGLAWRATTQPAAPAWGSTEVRRGNITKSISATGKVEALTTVNVGSQVSGTVAEMYVDFNSPVKKGQIIARLDASQLQAQLTQATANQLGANAAIQTGENAVLSADAAAQAAEFNVERTKSVLADAERNLDLTQKLIDEGVTARTRAGYGEGRRNSGCRSAPARHCTVESGQVAGAIGAVAGESGEGTGATGGCSRSACFGQSRAHDHPCAD